MPYADAPVIVTGFVEHESVGRVADPMEAHTDKKKRVTVRETKAVIAELVWVLESDDATGDDVAAALVKARDLIAA